MPKFSKSKWRPPAVINHSPFLATTRGAQPSIFAFHPTQSLIEGKDYDRKAAFFESQANKNTTTNSVVIARRGIPRPAGIDKDNMFGSHFDPNTIAFVPALLYEDAFQVIIIWNPLRSFRLTH
jgi:hypothetical protein